MKYILDNIKNIFKKPNHPKEPEDKDLGYNYITFLVDKETKEPYIKMNIQHLTYEDSKLYGEMLFDITAGLYQASMLDILVDFSKQDDDINSFVKNTILHWHALSSIKNELVSGVVEKPWLKRPQISPIEFNKNAK